MIWIAHLLYMQYSRIQGIPIFLGVDGHWMAIMNVQRQIKNQSFTEGDHGVKMK